MVTIFGRLSTTLLKANTPNYSLGLKKIPYLGYLITRYEIKPDQNKVKGINDSRKNTTTTEA